MPCAGPQLVRATFLYAADRDMLKLTQQEFETVPLIIKVEILIAAVTCMWGKNTPAAKFGDSAGI